MYKTTDPAGLPVEIPNDIDEDFAYFSDRTLAAADDHYRNHGYVVLRGCTEPGACVEAMAAFSRAVKQYPGYLYRQTGCDAQLNKFNERGFLMNPILNVQDVPERIAPSFRQRSLSVICNDVVGRFLKHHFGEPAKIVQTMYFEGNSETWAHQDTYYLDSQKIGTMVAAWYALEDINPGAGRFFVYDKSHLIDVKKNGGDFDIAFNHDRYKQLIVDIIRDNNLVCKAPALRRGDVLLWNAKTIHGSLKTSQPQYARNSLTAHFIPQSHEFLQFQSIIKKLHLRDLNGWQIHHPKPLDEIKPKVILSLESRFPRAFATAKKVAIKTLLRN
jgi:phytanoyl-CoA hydroxylase